MVCHNSNNFSPAGHIPPVRGTSNWRIRDLIMVYRPGRAYPNICVRMGKEGNHILDSISQSIKIAVGVFTLLSWASWGDVVVAPPLIMIHPLVWRVSTTSSLADGWERSRLIVPDALLIVASIFPRVFFWALYLGSHGGAIFLLKGRWARGFYAWQSTLSLQLFISNSI